MASKLVILEDWVQPIPVCAALAACDIARIEALWHHDAYAAMSVGETFA